MSDHRKPILGIGWPPILYAAGFAALALPLMMLGTMATFAPFASTLPTVIHTTADCDILRGVDQGHRYYVADCRPDRFSRRGVME